MYVVIFKTWGLEISRGYELTNSQVWYKKKNIQPVGVG